MIEIKQLTAERIEEIIAFDRLCFPADFWREEDWMDLLHDPRAVYYGLLADGKIAGDVFIYNWKGEKDYVKIMNIAVHPDYRGRGLARMLLNHAAEQMKNDGMHSFCGETRAANKAMQKVFEDCGYVIRSVEENYYDHPAESAYKYVLRL